MYKAIAFKEWLKIRWTFFILMIVNITVAISIYLKLSHNIEILQARKVWYNVIFMGDLYYNDFQYIPLLTGLVIATFQFMPEIISDRIKLTFHLPIGENKILFQMMLTGLIYISGIYLVSLILLSVITSLFFPFEVFESMILTVAPWFLAGFAIYFAITAIFIEPIWNRRAVLVFMFLGFISMLFMNYGNNSYSESITLISFMTFILIIPVFLSGFRFKRGKK